MYHYNSLPKAAAADKIVQATFISPPRSWEIQKVPKTHAPIERFIFTNTQHVRSKTLPGIKIVHCNLSRITQHSMCNLYHLPSC